MSLEQYFSFIAFTLFMFLIPGPAVIFSIHNGLNHGAKKALIATLGNMLALFCWLLVTALSLVLALSISNNSLDFIRLIGAAYLIYLGMKYIHASRGIIPQSHVDSNTVSKILLFRRGFIMTSTNPKAFAYLAAVIPQFITTLEALPLQIAILAPSMAASQFIAFGSYIIMANKLSAWLSAKGRLQAINTLAGFTLITFGIISIAPSLLQSLAA